MIDEHDQQLVAQDIFFYYEDEPLFPQCTHNCMTDEDLQALEDFEISSPFGGGDESDSEVTLQNEPAEHEKIDA